MLRAREWKDRASPYVCDFCRHKLLTRSEPRSCRSFSSLRKSSTPSGIKSTFQPAHATRSLSTTRWLRNSQGNEPPRPGRFGGFGVGGGGAKFGGFASSQSVSPANTPGTDGLLPHERAAKKESKPTPPPRAPPKQKAVADWDAKPSDNRKESLGRGLRARGPGHQAQAEKSRSVLADILKAGQTRRPGPNSDAQSTIPEAPKPTTTRDAPSESTEKKQSPAWGAFSQRKVATADLSQTSFGKPPTKPAPSWGAFSDRKTALGGSNIQRERRSGARNDGRKEPGPKDAPVRTAAEENDFWNQLESRVGSEAKRSQRVEGTRDQGSQSRFGRGGAQSTVDPDAQAFASQDIDQPASSATRQRKSRFEVDEEPTDRPYGKKASNKKKPQQRGNSRDDQYDMDENVNLRYEERARKKAEKQAQKLLEQEEQGPTPIFLPEFINVSSLAQGLKQRVPTFLHDLEEMGFENMTNDTLLTGETAALIAMEYGFEPTVDTGSMRDIRPRDTPEDVTSLPARPPIVTIMGHVDHGKTTLLDWLRKSSVAAQEHGGITQHIGAFVVKMSSGKPITFLDTPGHAAFLTMRQRGANVTDIVVLVVAADDSVMPQTIEALKHATAAKVPIIVAINKIDKEDARPNEVKADLARHGVQIEDYGGDVQVVLVSGKTGRGMDDLEENIVTLSEILDVRAEKDGMAEGWILESSIKQDGRAATMLVKRGTLRTGDIIVAGKTWARIRLLRNEAGVEVEEAGPGTPVEILGWRELPEAGTQALQAPDEDKAKTAIEYRQEMADWQESGAQLAEQEQRQREKAAAEAAATAAEEAGDEVANVPTEPGVTTQNYVVRADVAGSVEAVCGTIQELGNNEVRPRVLRSSAGQISEYDVDHASASNSILINFNSAVAPHIKARAEEAGVRILDYSVIYHLIDAVKETLSELLPVKIHHKVLGEADVLQVFPINVKKRLFKNIAGCKVRNGAIKKSSHVRILRKGEEVFDGKIDTLKHVKKNVHEMGKGSECGIGLEGFEDLQVDDQIQTYEIIEEKRTL